MGAGVKLDTEYEKGKHETTSEGETESIGQEYGIIGKISIPPRCKVTTTITTWAVTYVVPQIPVEVRIKSDTRIPVTMRNRVAQCFGCNLCNTTGYITAEDVFKDVPYDIDEGVYIFKYYSDLSYLGETTSIDKVETKL